MSLCEKIPLGAPLEVYGAEMLACIAIVDQNRPEGPGFFAWPRPTAPKGSLVCPKITRCNHSPNPPSSVRASYISSDEISYTPPGDMLDAGKAQDEEHDCAGAGGGAQAAGSSDARRLETVAAKGPIGVDTPSSRAAPAPTT